MTPRDLAYEALGFISTSGVSGPTLAAASAQQKRRIAADLTAVMQEIYEAAPALYRRTLGATLAAPQTVTVTATDGSTTVTTAATYVEGATLFIGGVFNQIFTENSVKRLLYPFSGSTGDQSATLYTDCIALDATVSEVLDQVFIADGRRLAARTTRGDFLTGVKEFPDYGRRLRWDVGKPSAGTPLNYWVEEFLLTDGNHSSARRLRVMPLPDQLTQISFDVRLRAPRYTVDNLGTDSVDSTAPIVVANDYHESLVRPLFLKRWASSPWFRDGEARKGIDEDAAMARARLAEFRTQRRRNRRLTAPI